MTTQTLNLIFSLGNLLLLLAIAVYLAYLKHQESVLKKEESRFYREADKILGRAQAKAEALMEETVAKSQEILAETKSFKKEIEENLSAIFEKAAQTHAQKLAEEVASLNQSFRDLFEEMKVKYLNQTKTILNHLEVSGQKGVGELSEVVKEETLDFRSALEKKMNEEVAKAEKEIEAYRLEQLKNIDNSLVKILSRVSQEVLGKAISLADHEELIIEALERAKREGIFNF